MGYFLKVISVAITSVFFYLSLFLLSLNSVKENRNAKINKTKFKTLFYELIKM